MWNKQHSVTKDFTRGGQTTLHNLRMVFQIIRKLIGVFLIILVSYNILWWYLGHEHYAYPLTVVNVWLQAQFQIFLGHTNDPLIFRATDGMQYSVLPENVIQSPFVKQNFITLKTYTQEGLFFGVMTALACCGLIAQLLWRIGQKQRGHSIVRGSTRVDNKTLKNLLLKKEEASDIQLAGIPIVKDSERAHFLISGTPGTGKSVCIAEVLDHIRAKGQRAIVYDKVGDFVAHYYRPDKDILLNPLDERCPAWEVWNECRDASDYDTLAAALMPLPPGSYDPFWINAARTIFSTTAFQLSHQKERSMQQLLRFLLTSDLNTLTELLKGTEAETLVSEKIEKTALSVKTVLSTYLKSMKYLKNDTAPFSIRHWVQENKTDSWLFVTSRADKHESLKPLISAWLEIAGSSLMSLAPDRDRRIWMSLDELPSLHRLPYLSSLLAESRKFGGCLITTVQSIAQLRDLYGNNATEAISGLCNTRIFFRTPEAHTAEWVSKSLGECEIDESQEGFSYGADSIRDGVSLHRQRVIRPVVMPSEITQLPDLQAYLKLPGDWPVTKLTFTYRARPVLSLPFIEKISSQPESVENAFSPIKINTLFQVNTQQLIHEQEIK